MGKGNGTFLRWTTKLSRGFIFLEFTGVSYRRLIVLNRRVRSILGTNTLVLNKTKIFSN